MSKRLLAVACGVLLASGATVLAVEEKTPGSCHSGDPYHNNNDPVHEMATGCDGIVGKNVGGCTIFGRYGSKATLDCFKVEGENGSGPARCTAYVTCREGGYAWPCVGLFKDENVSIRIDSAGFLSCKSPDGSHQCGIPP